MDYAYPSLEAGTESFYYRIPRAHAGECLNGQLHRIIYRLICLIVGGAIAYFTTAKWLAASFWVSAAMYINGFIAYVEDAQPDGFENPYGKDASDFVKGWGASRFALSSLAITIVLVIIGYLIQEYI